MLGLAVAVSVGCDDVEDALLDGFEADEGEEEDVWVDWDDADEFDSHRACVDDI